jgi:DNA-directed RNA polymerase specialized sigma24 family protein
MAKSTSKNSIALNELYSAYLHDPEGLEPLLTKVSSVAKSTFDDDDRAQEFVIMVWLSLPGLKDLPCTFGGWIWRRLQWRGIDYIRESRSVVDREVQVPEMVGEGGDSSSVEDTLDLLGYQSAQDSFSMQPRNPETVSDEFLRRVAQDLLLGYTQDEIFVRFGVNPSTLRNRLSRYRHSNEPTDELMAA